MPTPNAAALRETLAHIEANPATWKQTHYRCRTGMCFAGWRAEMSGGRWVHDANRGFAELLHADPDDDPADIFTWPGEVEAVTAFDRAKRLLGLDYHQADDLFGALNKLDDLRRIVAELCAEAEHAGTAAAPGGGS
jgi:hypothetical protein